jgi:hypothetical protein
VVGDHAATSVTQSIPPGLNIAILERTVRLALIGYYPEEFLQFREKALSSTASAVLDQPMFHVYRENDTRFAITVRWTPRVLRRTSTSKK